MGSSDGDTPDPIGWYAEPGPLTRLDGMEHLLADLPAEPGSIAKVVQGLVLHPALAAAYGVDVPDARLEELQIRSVAEHLRRALALDARPLAEARPPELRVLGNCRHFSTLAVALLRHAGIPARARCGFGGYFEAGRWLDHWIVEHHDGDRWVRADAQVDDLQRQLWRLPFDPGDLPPGRFLAGGEAWLACQEGREDGDAFGILDEWGQWFIQGNVARDLAALNKVELLPWDGWGDLARDVLPPGGEAYVDEISALIAADHLPDLRHCLATDPALQIPSTIDAHATPTGPQQVHVPELVGLR